jgi:hypothetical protein
MADDLVEKTIKDWKAVYQGGSLDAFREDLKALQKRDGNSQVGSETESFRKDRNTITDRLLADDKLPNLYLYGVVKTQRTVNGQKETNDEVMVIDPEASAKNKTVFGFLRTDKNGSVRMEDLDPSKAAQLGLFAHPQNPETDIKTNNVLQSDLNPNCHFASTLAGLAAEDPTALQKMVKDNKDGSYTVTLPGDASHPITVAAPSRWEIETFGNSDSGMWAAVIDKAVRQKNHTPFGEGGKARQDEQLLTNKPAAIIHPTEVCGFPANAIDAVGSVLGQEVACPNSNVGKSLVPIIEANNGKLGNVTPADFPRLLQEAKQKHMIVVADSAPSFKEPPVVIDTQGNKVVIEHNHDYTLVSIDASKNTALLRNPWGVNHTPDGKEVGNGYLNVPLSMFGTVFAGVSIGETAKTSR